MLCSCRRSFHPWDVNRVIGISHLTPHRYFFQCYYVLGWGPAKFFTIYIFGSSVPQMMSIEADLTTRNTQLKNRIFVALVVVSNSVGNFLLGLGMGQMPNFGNVPFFTYLISFATNGWLLLGIALMIVFMLSQLSMYSWADLSYVLPVTASTYILSALLSKFFLHDTVSFARWAGIVLISFGVIFVAETPVRADEVALEEDL